MPLNPQFNNYRSNKAEQRLVEDLVVESIKIQGTEAFYLPMENLKERDLIYGEDVLKMFTDAFPIEVYINNVTEYGGEKEFFTKFGLEIRNQVTVMLAKRTYHERVTNLTAKDRPKEGDLIYIPVLNGFGELYEIRFVNQTHDMSTLGRKVPFCYELELEKFKYSHEVISTGHKEIDVIQQVEAYAQSFLFNTLVGSFKIGEVVFESTDTTFANATASGTLVTINTPGATMNVDHIVGVFSMGTTVRGQSSGATCVFLSTDQFLAAQKHANQDNDLLNTQANGIIDKTESNPMGTI